MDTDAGVGQQPDGHQTEKREHIDGGMPFTNQESGRAGDSLAFCTFGLNGGQQTASRGTDAAHERVPSIMYRWLQIGPRAGDLRVSYALASHWRFRLMVTAVIHSWNAFTMMSWFWVDADGLKSRCRDRRRRSG